MYVLNNVGSLAVILVKFEFLKFTFSLFWIVPLESNSFIGYLD